MDVLDLNDYQSMLSSVPRVPMAILRLSGGDFNRLIPLIEDADREYRDILVAPNILMRGACGFEISQQVS
jgi:hypothetical protein